MIVIVNTGVANLSSVQFAFERLGAKTMITTDKNMIENASHVILPGVGTAHIAMQNLEQYELINCIQNLTQPVLGICLGMQLQYQFSEEGNVKCLSLLKNEIKKIPDKKDITIPHMGWNQITMQKTSPLLKNIPNQAYVYFVHSYADFSCGEHCIATTTHGEQFAAVIQHNNFYGTQFHPERSGKIGEIILKNFMELK